MKKVARQGLEPQLNEPESFVAHKKSPLSRAVGFRSGDDQSGGARAIDRITEMIDSVQEKLERKNPENQLKRESNHATNESNIAMPATPHVASTKVASTGEQNDNTKAINANHADHLASRLLYRLLD